MKEEDDLLTADFTDILDNNEEIDTDYVDAEVIKDDGYKFEILGYWHSKPILRQYKQYICVLGSKKQLLLINTDFPDLEKHSHIRTKTDGKGNISLSTVDYIFRCIEKRQFPKSNWVFICLIRLLDDDNPYKEYLLRKKERMKDKCKYQNTHR